MLKPIKFNKEKDANVNLVHIYDNLYTPNHQRNPLCYLKAGMILWVDRGDTYDVYELAQGWNENNEPESDFINRIIVSL